MNGPLAISLNHTQNLLSSNGKLSRGAVLSNQQTVWLELRLTRGFLDCEPIRMYSSGKMDERVVVLNSVRGYPEFSVDGYIYEKEKEKTSLHGTTIYARCVKKRREGCNARIVINELESAYNVKKSCSGDKHNHPPMTQDITRRNIMNAMKASIVTTPTRPVKHSYNDVLQDQLNCTENRDEVISCAPTFDQISSVLYRQRAKLRPPLPKDRESIDLNDEFTKLKGDNFVIFNTEGNEKMIGFGTEKFLEILCTSQSTKTIYMDGTFKVVPKLFYQLYTIHAFYRKQMFPFVYILLPNKSEKTYSKMFDELKNAATRLGYIFQPNTIMVDYELAVINASRKAFPNVTVKGCLFHYNQALWQNFSELGLSIYKNDSAVMKLFRFCSAMALVRMEDLDDAWLLVAADAPSPQHAAYQQCQEFIDYFVGTWMEGKHTSIFN